MNLLDTQHTKNKVLGIILLIAVSYLLCDQQNSSSFKSKINLVHSEATKEGEADPPNSFRLFAEGQPRLKGIDEPTLNMIVNYKKTG